jgi:hypothetical protein
MRQTMMVHAYALYRDLDHRDRSVTIPPEASWKVPEPTNPWKSSAPFTPEELAGFISQGIASNPLSKLDFKPVVYGEELTGTAGLKLSADRPPGSLGPGRGKQVFYTQVEKAPAELRLKVTGGLIVHYRDRGNVKVSLWKLGGASQTGEKETLVAQDDSAPPDGQPHAIKLPITEPGTYRVTVEDGHDKTLVEWDCPLPMAMKSTADEPMNGTYGSWMMYFYVPKGTRTIGFFGGQHGEIRDAADRPLFWLNGREPNYYSVEVPDGQDGQIWSVRYGRGAIQLLTVPPYFARSAAELLLPAEVVRKDAAN